MNCLGCDSSGYRKICNYDDEHNTCEGRPILGQSSFKCVSTGFGDINKQCVHINAPPGQGRYPSMKQCEDNCSSPRPNIQSKSYQCMSSGYGSGGVNKQCVQINAPPGQGRYPSMKQCEDNCTVGIY